MNEHKYTNTRIGWFIAPTGLPTAFTSLNLQVLANGK